MKRKPRVKRPRKEKIKGYDSVWEYILHDTLDTLPDEWVDPASRETDEFNVRQQELQELEDKYAS